MTRTLQASRTRAPGLALVAISAGYFIVILDATIVAIALNRMAIGLHTTVTGLEWVVDGYTVAVAALLVLGGGLADRFGPRRSFQAGLACFAVASLACACAPGVGLLVAARVVQGCGAALLIPASLALIRFTYPELAARARATGLWGAIGSVAASSGPVLGGVLSEHVGWPAIFAINVPVCAVAAVLVRRAVPSVPGVPRRIPALGHVSVVCVMAGVTALAILAGARPLRALPLTIAAAVAVAGSIAAVAAARSGKSLLPSGLRRDRHFTGGSMVGLAQNFGFYGQLFAISLFLQRGLGLSPTAAGLALLPEAAIGILASTLGGRHAARRGPRVVIVTGLVTGAAGLFGLALLSPHTPYLLMVIPLLLTGFGMAYTMPAATNVTVSAADPEHAGLAAAAFNAARQFGSALGVAVLGALTALTSGSLLLALMTAALAYLAAAVVARRTVSPGV